MNPGLRVHAEGGARGQKIRTLFKVLFYFSVIKAMFVNSCLCIVGTCNIDLGVMDWKSAWPTCHGTVISVVMVQWFCSISETQIDIWTSYLQILKWYDTIIHLNIAWPTCHGSVISVFMVQWFCPISESPFDIWTSYLQIMKWYDTMINLNMNVVSINYMSWFKDFCFHGPVILPYI